MPEPASSRWDAGTRALRTDPHLGPLIASAPPCPFAPERGVFRRLARAVFAQQLSAKGAATLFARFEAHAGRATPASVLAACRDGSLDDDTLRFCGLSRQKKSYLVDLAEHFAGGRLDARKLNRMGDDEAVAALTAVRGVGRWTAQMWLIFGAARPDVWPVDDLAIRIATGRVLGLAQRPTARETAAIGERWRPHRTLAAWLLWRSLDTPARSRARADAAPSRPAPRRPSAPPAGPPGPRAIPPARRRRA
ncbi:DNA-3-methyladenine glycosylase family protein [Phycisphaera mikurensis]|uniref:DNA-3-methyladenine glycosylase II n=1 Tax=Phycisphaera mikurensis (strain NBRC 102666 / KCTC 22515 / FYK2301M01) TaxID=1142394 RepID=I0IBW4_PHYMF|nr:DNA-3-methyladenine glycosylase [Phycisphaera mikurensis]MBB6442022.1 DNA-3-methyladenine glycosylase II [Phycisphaera mikurensis]BAM02752.1 DNA-3-methyladenine glycosylase II [Phycisphaera mikurensis NBRC 102666]